MSIYDEFKPTYLGNFQPRIVGNRLLIPVRDQIVWYRTTIGDKPFYIPEGGLDEESMRTFFTEDDFNCGYISFKNGRGDNNGLVARDGKSFFRHGVVDHDEFECGCARAVLEDGREALLVVGGQLLPLEFKEEVQRIYNDPKSIKSVDPEHLSINRRAYLDLIEVAQAEAIHQLEQVVKVPTEKGEE